MNDISLFQGISTPDNAPDVDSIRDLHALEHGKKWGLIEPGEGGRWKLLSEDADGRVHRAGLSFTNGGRQFFNHKIARGGLALDLVMQHIGNERQLDLQDDDVYRRLFGAAVRWIAAREGLYLSWDALRARAEKLAGAPTFAEDEFEEARKLWRLLGRDSPFTVADGMGGPCWIPTAPLFGGDDVVRSGWTLDAVERAWEGGLFVVDIDQGVPSALLYRFLSAMSSAGAPVSAVVLTSFCAEERAKCHLYFRAKVRARSVELWTRWAYVLRDMMARVVDRLDLGDDAALLNPDGVSLKPTQMYRLPGFSKPGAEWAAVVDEHARVGGVVDFVELTETQPRTVERASGKRVEIGSEFVFYKAPTQADPVPPPVVVGREIYPLGLLHNVDTHDHELLVRISTKSGRKSYCRLPTRYFSHHSHTGKAAADLADAGAQIRDGNGGGIWTGLGMCLDEAWCVPMQACTRPGVHRIGDRYAYAYGIDQVYGAQVQFVGANRFEARGTLAGWQEGVRDLLERSPLALGVVGVAFAGALVDFLELGSFGVHLKASSSSGKSTTARVARTVWTKGELQGWDSTARAFEDLLEQNSSACCVPDEVSQNADMRAVKAFAKMLGNNTGRARKSRSGEAMPVKKWRLTAISSGENTMADIVGASWQGGDSVRLIDLEVHTGELTKNHAQAEAVGEALKNHYGHAGRRFVEYLFGLEQARSMTLRALDLARERLFDGARHGPEFGRIVKQFALVEVALRIADAAGALPSTQAQREAAVDVMMACSERCRAGAQTPEERAWSFLSESMVSDPGRWPLQGEAGRPPLLGVRRFENEDGKSVFGARDEHVAVFYTSEAYLKRHPMIIETGVSARNLLSWIVDAGKGERWYGRLDGKKFRGIRLTDSEEEV